MVNSTYKSKKKRSSAMHTNSSSSLNEIYDDVNSEHTQTDNGLNTEYEDAEQQRLSGLRSDCEDDCCTGGCQRRVSNNVNSNVAGNEQENEESSQSRAGSGQKKGFVCVDRMLNDKCIKNYRLLRTLGKGSFSKVKLAVSPSNRQFAIKIVPRNLRYNSINKESRSKREERIFREAIITAFLSHPHIIKLHAFFYNDLHFYMVYEYVSGQSLLRYIRDRGHLEEDLARKLFVQIVDAVRFMHRNAVVHRDLKIENILIDKAGNIKIIDFGLSNFYDTKKFLGTFCGSLQFAAPELLRGRIYVGPEVDLWSLGIVLYVMVIGALPFDDRDITVLHSKIKKGRFTFHRDLSPGVRKLISGLIVNDVSRRYRMKDVLASEWLNDGGARGQLSDSMHPYFNPTLTSIAPKMRTEHRLNMSYIRVLKKIGGKAFSAIESDVQSHMDDLSASKCICPTTAMYRLMSCHFQGRELPHDIVTGSRKETLHRLIAAFHANETEIGIVQDVRIERPRVRVQNTLLKGMLTGISCNSTGSNGRLSNAIQQFFRLHHIKTMVGNDKYNCLLRMENGYVEFTLSFYYNMVMKKHYVCIRKMHGHKELFDDVVVWLKEVLDDAG